MGDEIRARELKIIIEQLGREPRNLLRIAKYCADDYPAVLTTYPLLDKEEGYGIFPTIYWLSCPKLVNEISQLEGAGFIKKIQSKINNQPQQLEKLMAAHQNYAQSRVDLLNQADLEMLKEKYSELWRVISQSGVGGIMNQEGIKCLHTHYADFLVNNNNPVGKIVAELLKQRFNQECESRCREC